MTDRLDSGSLDARLEAFLAARTSAVAPRDLVDEIVARAASLPQARPARWFLPDMWTRGAGRPAAVLTLLVVLVVALLAVVAVAGSRRPTVSQFDAGWSRVALGGPGSSASRIGGGLGWLFAAVQPADQASGDELWRSRDGIAWERLATTAVFDGARIRGFAETASGLLAYGSTTDGTIRQAVATWITTDGTTWLPLSGTGSTNPVPGQLSEELEAVVEAGPGYVAVGTISGAEFGRVAAWTSTDAVTWQQVDASPEGVEVAGLVRVGGGLLTLARVPGEGVYAWTSPDGAAWTRGALVSAGTCCGPIAMANMPGGTPLGAIAVGSPFDGGGNVPTAWTTRDGATWAMSALPLPSDGRCEVTGTWPSCPIAAMAVATDANHVVVAGGRMTGENGRWELVTWSSPDGGASWTVVAGLPLYDMGSAARGETGPTDIWTGGPNAFLVTGQVEGAGAVIWRGEPFPFQPVP